LACLALVLLILGSISGIGVAQVGEPPPEDLKRTLELFLEKPLPLERDAFRIVVWPTFHKPVLIMVQRTASGADVVAKTLSGQGGYEVGGIDSEKTFVISHHNVKKIERTFDNAKLERFLGRDKRYDPQPDGSVMVCLDGASWEVERVVGGKYLYVERYCPEEKELIDIGYILLKNSRLKISKKELF
jgi:hypothetical protein